MDPILAPACRSEALQFRIFPATDQLTAFKEPLNNSVRARPRLCGRLRLGLGERGLVVPNERAQTSRRPRKGPSQKGFAGKAASRARRVSAVAMATVARLAPHDLRLFRLKRAPRRVIQRFLNESTRSVASPMSRPNATSPSSCPPITAARYSARSVSRYRRPNSRAISGVP